MTLYLVQHGLCLEKEIDPNRGLSAEGRTAIIQVAQTASNAGVTAPTICHSGKLRALQTAEIFSEHLKTDKVEQIKGLSPLDNVEDFAKKFQFAEKTMIVGHLPFMERLSSYLLTGNQDLTIVKFQNAGIVCLDLNETNNWYIKWTIMPVLD